MNIVVLLIKRRYIIINFVDLKKKEQKTDSDEEVEKKRVINAVCFATNPDGNTTVALMENDLMVRFRLFSFPSMGANFFAYISRRGAMDLSRFLRG